MGGYYDDDLQSDASWHSSPERSTYWEVRHLSSPKLGVASSRVQIVEMEREVTKMLCRDLAKLLYSSKLFPLRSDDKIIPILENGNTFRDLSLILSRIRRRLNACEDVILTQEARIAFLEHEQMFANNETRLELATLHGASRTPPEY